MTEYPLGIYPNIVLLGLKVCLNGEKLKSIPLKLGTRQGCVLSLNLFNIVLEVLARAIRQKKIDHGVTSQKISQTLTIC